MTEIRRGRRAVLIGVGRAETDLGTVPANQGPDPATYSFIGFQAFEGRRKVADFGHRS